MRPRRFNILALIAMAFNLAIMSPQPSFAVSECYDEVQVQEPITCDPHDPNSKSADFTAACNAGGMKVVKVPRECDAKWVAYGAANPSTRPLGFPYKAFTHAEVCANVGLLPTTINGASCASGTYYGTRVYEVSRNEGGSSTGSGGQKTVTSFFCYDGRNPGPGFSSNVGTYEPGESPQEEQHLLTHYACGE